ncbi:MAG: metallophosphatase domain-containing protein [Ferruginibacter sp.]
MKIISISDTHGKHKDLILPPGDTIIHAGDISMKGELSEILNFFEWFTSLNYKFKILIAGNHDFYFERESDQTIKGIIPNGIIYLNDNGITLEHVKFWGSPITPWFFNWAFNRHRGEPIQRHWDLIPNDTDVLITHGPIFRTLDTTKDGQHVGCKDLFNKVHEIKPQAHICGHIHEAYGMVEISGTKFINASVVNEKYNLVNTPIVFEIN